MRRDGVALVMMLACAALLRCSGDGDGLSAGELADRLSQALDFEGATDESGAPPDEHAGDVAFPQITHLDASGAVGADASVQAELLTDFSDTGRIAGAVVQVDQASGFLRIASPYSAETGSVVLRGQYRKDAELAGRSFTLRTALLDDAGSVGNYVTWQLGVPADGGDADTDADTDADSDADTDTSGPLDGTWHMTDCTCNGDPKDLGTNPVYVTYAGPTGYVTSTAGTCETTIHFTASYPEPGVIDSTITTMTCEPADCMQGCGTTINMDHHQTYVLERTYLTVTEDPTPAGEYGCDQGRQVCNLVRQ